MVMIRCPVTGKEVPTGFGMDRASFESCQFIDNSFGCAACGQMHTWSKGDAFVKD